MSQPSDNVEPKSYTVVWDNNTPRVKPSHWAIGYTASHRDTPKAAILHEADRLERLINELEAKHELLQELYKNEA